MECDTTRRIFRAALEWSPVWGWQCVMAELYEVRRLLRAGWSGNARWGRAKYRRTDTELYFIPSPDEALRVLVRHLHQYRCAVAAYRANKTVANTVAGWTAMRRLNLACEQSFPPYGGWRVANPDSVSAEEREN